MQIFVHKHMCIHIHSRYADRCFMTDFLGVKSHFIVFSGFHDINIPLWSVSCYQFDVTGRGVGEEIHILRSLGPVGAASSTEQLHTFIYTYMYIHKTYMFTSLYACVY